MKPRSIIIFSGIMIMLAIAIWWVFREPEEDHQQDLVIQKQRAEPEFTEEGLLYFINPESADTLSRLTIEVVDNEADIIQGLMNRSKLGADQGMFFIFGQEDEQVFWMKNTMIALDIIFVNASLEIIHIAKHTIPYSEEPVMSMGPAKYVIEVRAGYTDSHGITRSDLIRYDLNESDNS